MKKLIALAKALFKLKNIKDMSPENIRKIWVVIGTLLATLNLPFIPEFVIKIFGPEGTDIVFTVIGSVLALIQFLGFRTGEDKQPKQLRTKVSAMYWLPWTKA
jgi:hypothetical protein